MRKSRKALSLLIALATALVAAFGLFAACSNDKTATGEDGPNVTYVFGTTEGISLDKDAVSLGVGEKTSIVAFVTTDNGNKTSDFVIWTSSDDDVARVSSGVVTGISSGKATITASIAGTNFSANCLVTVTNGETLTVGVKDDVRNFGYYDYVTREYFGMEIDLAYMIADKLCYENVKPVTVNPDEREDYLENEIVDMVIATYTITEERAKVVDFSSSYYTDSVEMLLGDEYSRLVSLTELSDFPSYLETNRKTFRVGTVEGTTAFESFDEFCRDAGITRTSPLLGDYFLNETYADYESCWEALEEGEIDAFVSDHSILQSYANGSAKYRFLPDEFSAQDYGVATKKGSSLSALVGDVVDKFLEDGTMDELLSSYGLA